MIQSINGWSFFDPTADELHEEYPRRTLAMKVFNDDEITKRHRHRYEINSKYIDIIEKHGGKFSAFAKVKGENKNLKIPEMFEIPGHKFFISCQFHPELTSRPFECEKLFQALIKAGMHN